MSTLLTIPEPSRGPARPSGRSAGPRSIALALLLAACGGPRPAGPNVIVISVDMLRPDHLSCYGYAQPTSPAIDRLAAEGVLYEEHVSSSSWTLPAHTALFTSLPDAVHGVTDPTSTALSEKVQTMAERFALAGYRTAGFYSGPYLHPAFGLGQGFQHYENCTATPAALDGRERSQWVFDRELMLASHRDVTGPRVYAAAHDWLESNKQRPFFAFVHFWDAHFDFIPPPPYDRLYDPDYQGPIDGRDFYFDNERYGPDIAARDLRHLLALYDGEIRWTDGFIGKLLDDLDAWGLTENTVVVVTSDHGTEFFEHGWKCHRSTLFDEEIRIPLVIRAPGRLPAGKRVTELTRIVDVLPTLLELAGLPAGRDCMGASLCGLARGEPEPSERYALSELDGDWAKLRSLRSRDGKLVQDLGKGGFALYDLGQDPGEHRPSRELSGPLGKRLAHALTAALEAAEEERQRLDLRPGKPLLTPELERSLRAYGYTGD